MCYNLNWLNGTFLPAICSINLNFPMEFNLLSHCWMCFFVNLVFGWEMVWIVMSIFTSLSALKIEFFNGFWIRGRTNRLSSHLFVWIMSNRIRFSIELTWIRRNMRFYSIQCQKIVRIRLFVSSSIVISALKNTAEHQLQKSILSQEFFFREMSYFNLKILRPRWRHTTSY